jgi:hypothetical protein
MAVFKISYDLRRPGKDYSRLYAALRKLGATRVLLSEWATKIDRVTATEVRDALLPFIDTNDRLVVVAISDWATWNGIPGGVALLKRHMP